MRAVIALLIIAVVVGGAIYVAKGSGGTSHPTNTASASTTAPVSYSVGIASCTFVDHTRSTHDYANNTTLAGRVLPTEIRYPTISPAKGKTETTGANPAKRHGPFPLIVFGHGYNLTPDTYALLLDHWVRAGYVVAAPLFPDTNQRTVTAEHDISAPESDDINQPADMAFLTSAIVKGSVGSGPSCQKLHSLVNTKEVAAAGQSDGATTVGMMLYDKLFAPSSLGFRFNAAVLLSGQEWPAPTDAPNPYGVLGISPPMLVTQSATDECNPPQDSTKFYNDVAMKNKWFFTIKHANHLPPYVGSNAAAFNAVARVTTDFFNMELKGEKIAHGFVRANNVAPTVAQLSTGLVAPALAPKNDVYQTCYIGV